jgi:hypothetical protein
MAPTRRELLMSLGALAIGIAGAARAAPRPTWPIRSVEALAAKPIWSARHIRVWRIGTTG